VSEARRWDRAAAWLLAATLCSAIARRALTGELEPEGEPAPVDAKLWSALAVQGVWLCLTLAIASVLRGGSVSSRLGLGPGRLRASSVAVLAGGLLALSFALSALLGALELRDVGALGEVNRIVRATRGPSLALALLAMGLAPGIAEELLFRGLVQRSLARQLGPPIGILGGAALFALAHADPVQSSAAFLLGLYLGAVAQLAGSIRAAIACHVVNNLVATSVAWLEGVPLPGDLQALPTAAYLAIGLGLAMGSLGWVARRERPEPATPRG
jgi:membrane protease YdiL (CAAX protease family)